MRMILALFILSLFSSCKSDKIEYQNVTYLHVSHTRTNANPNLDATIEGIDYSKYDVLMLGGDLANLTSLDTQTMDHANSILMAGRADLVAVGRPHLADPYWTLREGSKIGSRNEIWPMPYLPGRDQAWRLADREAEMIRV